MAARETAKDLAVYVIGKSGHCFKDYTGCGKSCLCRQYMYNEYVEESYSTLLQSEFDGCVINQQHAIYWGKKEETYKETTKGQCSVVAKVNFEVFEHTIFYQDGTNNPFYGSDNYEYRIFTPLKSYLNKHSFKSRDEVLSPEDYDSKKFSYLRNVPVAYLYVIDVSQSCPVFEEQLQLMSTLIKSIHKKKHTCVVVASKFDSHSRTNVEQLESLANKLKVAVIQCSAKYNTNIDTAFKYLAAKALHLKKLPVNVLTHAEAAVQKRVQKPIEDETDDTNLDIIPHINMANRSDIRMRYSMLQNDPSEDYDEPPEIHRRDTYISGDHSGDSFESGDEQLQEERSEMLSNLRTAPKILPLESSLNHLAISDSSTVLLPNDSKAAKNKQQEQKDEVLSSLHSSKHYDHEKPPDKLLAFTGAKHEDMDVQKSTQDQEELSSDDSQGYVKDNLLAFIGVKHEGIDMQQSTQHQDEPLYDDLVGCVNEGIQDQDEVSSDDSEGYIKDELLASVGAKHEDMDMQKSTQDQDESSSDELEGYVNEGMDTDKPSSAPVSGKVQGKSPYLEITSRDDQVSIHSEYYDWCEVRKLVVGHTAATAKSSSVSAEGIPELRCIDSATSNYVRMYKSNRPALKKDSDVYTYDYACHTYIQMCRHKRRCSGVPPRNIKRIGYQPPLYANVVTTTKEDENYVNFRIIEQHKISNLPPRKIRGTPTPKRHTNYKPPMPPRNIPRPKCYLSARSAVP